MKTPDDRFHALEAWAKLSESLDLPAPAAQTLLDAHPAPERALHWFVIWLLLDARYGALRWATGTAMAAGVEAAALASWRQLFQRDASAERIRAFTISVTADQTAERELRWTSQAVLDAIRGEASGAAWAIRAASRGEPNRTFGTPLNEAARLPCLRAQQRTAVTMLETTTDDGPWTDALASEADDAAVAALFSDWLAERQDERAALVRELNRILAANAAT